MAPLLKKIRIELIQTKDMKNYFKYAIGEIILVVVGILIALYIKGMYSDWQADDQIHKVGWQIVEDINNDTAMVNSILKVYEPLDSIYEKILGNELNLEEYKQCKECASLITFMQPFSPNQNGYNILRIINLCFLFS